MIKATNHIITGMQRDLSSAEFNSKFAYENKNVRITPTDDNTALSLVNEKGTKETDIELEGTAIGTAVINDTLVIFTTDDNGNDKIYKVWFEDNELKSDCIVATNLNFNTSNPIETQVFFENTDIQKVYWVDGRNQPRVINIADKNLSDDSYYFDFVQRLALQEQVSVKKNSSAGLFSSGVIQYAFTYYNKYGQETNIFHTTPLYYISFNDRGGNPTETISNSFQIKISNLDTRFDYVRIYSIQRTSLDTTPIVKRVVDLAVTDPITYIDTGTTGDTVDPMELLYIGGEEIIAGTLAQKDNTLFLGDIETKVRTVDKNIQNKLRTIAQGEDGISFSIGKSLTYPEPSGYYVYENQLNNNSQQIKTFKYLEWYRFGIQFQHVTGKWSNPIFLQDLKNDIHIETNLWDGSNFGLPVANLVIKDNTLLESITKENYIKARPVIVYPTINDREVICQGVVCPTVYNVADRYDNSPFAQSSWFARPNSPFDVLQSKEDFTAFKIGMQGSGIGFDYKTAYSRGGFLSNNDVEDLNESINLVNKGAWAEFRHNQGLPTAENRNAEIQMTTSITEVYVNTEAAEDSVRDYVNQNSINYNVDQSIFTLHSPDIEFDTDVKNLDLSKVKFRIVGMVPMTANASDIDIQTSTPPLSMSDGSIAPGFYKEFIGNTTNFINYNSGIKKFIGDSMFGWRSLLTGVFWLDGDNDDRRDGYISRYVVGYAVYPWQKSGSLNCTKNTTTDTKSALLEKKVMSNLKYSYKTAFINKDKIWYAETDSSTRNGISGAVIFDSDVVSMVKIPKPKNSCLDDIVYYGNIDKLLVYNKETSKEENNVNYRGGYPLHRAEHNLNSDHGKHDVFTDKLIKFETVDESDDYQFYSLDPIRIKYKSTPHAVMALNYVTNNNKVYQKILPTINDKNDVKVGTITANSAGTNFDGIKYFWEKGDNVTQGVSQTVYDPDIKGKLTDNIGHGWLWLGELYRDDVANRFGGNTEEVYESNQWLPCGDTVALTDNNGNPCNMINIIWTEGDTYYQRYDHIKTYPFTNEDINQIVEIISFMCESRVNLDGRYDRNRGQLSNLLYNPTNFNLLNDVYSQKNNFFTYHADNLDKLILNKFPNTITWSKTKTVGELTDTWTNVTLASTLDLDGDKGKVRALRRFNDNLISFQDTGISQILYNENTQISTTQGVPIEIANSGKVTGKRYISDKIGCTNKWSIGESINGLYFIDDITKDIYLFNGSLSNISDKNGFHSWMTKVCKGINVWNPKDFNGFVTHYDKINEEVFFTTKDESLCFSEQGGGFSSFYSYENTPYFINLKDQGIWIRDNKLWLHHEGDYNMFFDSYKLFYTTIIVNPDMQNDKIFNNIEFRSDSWQNDKLLDSTFDKLYTWNEYQQGESDLTYLTNYPSNLKKKFRIWRANIPRDKDNKLDRMRNPWLYIKLAKEKENTDKTVLHDMRVYYFE